MSNVAALKKKAAEFEQRKQLDKAIATYREILDAYDAGGEDQVDVGLYNRVADLLLRQGNTPDAVTLYERAVDLYTEGGFFNNAIALCNKILRTSPGRASVYYKLGKISAAKGFKGDAKQNFLEYADRMQKSGAMQEAFRALKEFADLCPDQDDIRLLLADQLTKAGKKTEALDQLQLLYARYDGEGRRTEALATVQRMKDIDPSAEARAGTHSAKVAADDDLVFLDLTSPTTHLQRRSRAVPRVPTADTVPLIEIETSARPDAAAAKEGPLTPVSGLERTSLVNLTPVEPTPLPADEFARLDLGAIHEAQTEPSPVRDLALRGDLPTIGTGDSQENVVLDFRGMDSASTSGAEAIAPAADRATDTPPAPVEPLDEGDAEAVPDSVVDLPFIDAGHGPGDLNATSRTDAPEMPASFGSVPIDQVEEPPPVRRSSTALAASASLLAARLAAEPANWALHRQYAEALLEGGDRETGFKELEKALAGYEKADDLDGARAVADELIRLRPSSVRYHQKRVEYAFRSSDRPALAEAYVALADALFRDGQAEKAKVVYARVLEITPSDLRALAALEAFARDDAPDPARAKPAATPPRGRRYTGAQDTTRAAVPADVAADDDDGYVSLGDWLRADEGPKSTRMVVAEQEPTGDEQKDFSDMLKKFKQGVAENVEEEDHASHYDLGVAYKEMGLIDEAIAQFQKAFRGRTHRVRTYEALGQCFVEKKQLQVASTILQRALHEPGVGDEQLVGVLYLLGYVSESQGKHADAKGYYERVFGVDIEFRDVAQRLDIIEKALA
jgi:tetratricopeptide (TPR) repeat protein